MGLAALTVSKAGGNAANYLHLESRASGEAGLYMGDTTNLWNMNRGQIGISDYTSLYIWQYGAGAWTEFLKVGTNKVWDFQSAIITNMTLKFPDGSAITNITSDVTSSNVPTAANTKFVQDLVAAQYHNDLTNGSTGWFDGIYLGSNGVYMVDPTGLTNGWLVW